MFADALSIGTARTTQILRAVEATGQPAADHRVREEVAATYAALVPAVKERRNTLEQHIAWLAAVTSQTLGAGERTCCRPLEELPRAGADAERPSATVTQEGGSAYESLRDVLRQQSDGIATRAARITHSGVSATVWASVGARLVHIRSCSSGARIVLLPCTGKPRSSATSPAR